MTGRIQASLKKEGKRLAWLLIILLLYFGALINYFQIEKYTSTSVFLSDVFPSIEQVQDILEREKNAEDREELCFLYQGGFANVEEKEYNRWTEVSVVGIMGNAQLYDYRALGFSPEDSKGCLVDTETAEKLFGTASAVGRDVTMNGNTYKVRGVVPWKLPLFVYHPDEEGVLFTRMFVQKKQQTNKENQVNQILIKYGFRRKIVEDENGRWICVLALLAVPAFLMVKLLIWALKEQKAHKKKEFIFWAWEGVFLVIFLLLVVWLGNTLQIPKDWIPGKWSDFQFYQDKWMEFGQQVKLYLALPKTALQVENIIFLCKSLVKSILAFIFLCLNFHQLPGKSILTFSRAEDMMRR